MDLLLSLPLISSSTSPHCSKTRWRTFAYNDAYRSTFSFDLSTSTIRTKTFVLLVILRLLLVLCVFLPPGAFDYASLMGVITTALCTVMLAHAFLCLCRQRVKPGLRLNGIAKWPTSLKLLKSICLSQLGYRLYDYICLWNLSFPTSDFDLDLFSLFHSQSLSAPVHKRR